MASQCVDLEQFVAEFVELEQKILELSGRNGSLEVKLEDASRRLKFHCTKEKSLNAERDALLSTVNGLQQSLQEQSDLRVENETLRKDLLDLRRHNEKTTSRQQGALEALRLQSRRQLELTEKQASSRLEEKEAEVEKLLEEKEVEVEKLLEEKEKEVEEVKKKLRDTEREKQSELLKLQMEFGAKLARVQSSAQSVQHQHHQQHQQHGSSFLPQSVFKRKLQFLQEEKNQEIASLRQRISELEGKQRVGDGRLKRRRI